MSDGAGTLRAERSRQAAWAPGGARTLRPRSMVGPYVLVWFYRRWLRLHLAQELLAGMGVAVAVALVFATIVASSSISGATTQAVQTVTGPAMLQLHARSASGISEALVERAQRLPGVREAAGLLEETATLRSGSGASSTVDLAGAGVTLTVMDGLAHTIPGATLSADGIGLSSRTAAALAIGGTPRSARGSVQLFVRGRSTSMPVSAVLGPEAFGALSQTSVAVMRLRELQKLTGLGKRVSRVLLVPRRGREAQVRAELGKLANDRIDVAAADQDDGLIEQALRPSDQASILFATISGLLGALLATAALLLTAPDRRLAIVELRLMGMRRSAIVEMFVFQALVLGAIASAVGVLGGYGLSVSLLHQSPRYLAEAFTLGTETTLTATAFAIGIGIGLVSTILASALPLLDLRRGNPLRNVYQQHGIPGNALGAKLRRTLDVSALVLLLAASALLASSPSLALLSCALLALATVGAVPLALSGVMRLGGLLAERRQSLTVLPFALSSLRATTLRSLALAATGAVALFGSIALGGARGDLEHGIAGFAHSYAADADIWVGNRGDDQAVIDFAAGELPGRIARIDGVASVASFQGGFAVMNGRRVWVIARPAGSARHVLASQIVSGSAAAAERRLAQGGWVVVSKQIAEQQHARLGGRLELPTPSGEISMRIAALSTNLAWSPGAVFLGSSDYAKLWQHSQPTAIGVTLDPGADVEAVRHRIEAALGPRSGVVARRAPALQSSIDALTGEGLAQLQQISSLLLFAAILAMAAALISGVWQRRSALAGLRLNGVPPSRLRRILLTEAALILGAGCLTGALAGVYGQTIIDAYLAHVTGFPVTTIAVDTRPLAIFALVVAIVLAAACTPIVAASRVPPSLALGE